MRRVALSVLAMALTMAGAIAGATPKLASAAAGDPDWLNEINVYREASGLQLVSEQPSWDMGLQEHLTYLGLTPSSYLAGAYESEHTENPASPYYTPRGAQEAGSSNLLAGGADTSLAAIDRWLAAPFHAVGMLRPALSQVAFVRDSTFESAGLDVISGFDLSAPPSTTPVLFPGNGMTTDLTTFGGEQPSPVGSCAPAASPAQAYGLPIIALLPQAPDPALLAQVRGPDGSVESSQDGSLCVVDEDTYQSTDPIYGPTGAQILQGDKAVFLIPNAPLTAGRHWVTITQPGQPDISWSFVVAPTGSPSVGGVYDVALSRVAGINRDATAIQASRMRYPGPGSAPAVVLASDRTFPDALAGTPLAIAAHGPLLLTPPTGSAEATLAEIQRVLTPGGTVYVLGGESAVSATADTTLRRLDYAVVRLAGATRYDTAVAIAAALGDPTTVVEVTGTNFADGVSAGSAVASLHGAILLTDGSSPDSATQAYLAAHIADTRYAVGGPACAGDPTATCLSGASRYDTSVLVAQQFFPSPSAVGFASGASFPDALSGGASVGAGGQPLILVPPTGELPSSLVAYLTTNASTLTSGAVFGGVAAVDNVVASELQ